MAAVALANGLNANMLRNWVAEADANPEGAAPVDHKPPVHPRAFVPLALAARHRRGRSAATSALRCDAVESQ